MKWFLAKNKNKHWTRKHCKLFLQFNFFIYPGKHLYLSSLVEEWSLASVFWCVLVLNMTADRHSSHADPRRDNSLPVSLSSATSPSLLLRCHKTSGCRQAVLIVRWKCAILKSFIISAISYFIFLLGPLVSVYKMVRNSASTNTGDGWCCASHGNLKECCKCSVLHGLDTCHG